MSGEMVWVSMTIGEFNPLVYGRTGVFLEPFGVEFCIIAEIAITKAIFWADVNVISRTLRTYCNRSND